MSLITIDYGDTAIPTADVPFQVVSDGQHVYVFRQSAQNTLLVNRFVYEDVLQRLVNTWEVRYRRSRNANIPADRNDTFGTTDMNGNHFIEPTTEMSMINNLHGGWFSVLILPTSLKSIQRWQIFAYDSSAQSLNSFSFLRSQDGMFDLGNAIQIGENHSVTVPPENSFNLTFEEPYGGTNASLNFTSGPTAVLYSRQERFTNEYGRPQLLKREARVMVAIGVTNADNEITNEIAVMDFGVGTNGELAQISAEAASNLSIAHTPLTCNALEFNPRRNTEITVQALKVSDAQAPAQWMVGVWLKPLSKDGMIIQGGQVSGYTAEQMPLFSLSLVDGIPQFTIQVTTESNGQTSTSWLTAVADSPLLIGDWHYLMGFWDGETETIGISVDGYVQSATPQSSGSAIQNIGLSIGGPNGFTGHLGNVQIFSVYTPLYWFVYMNAGIDPTQHAGLVAFWSFVQTSNLSADFPNLMPDLTDNHNNATVSGARWVPTSAPPAVTTWLAPDQATYYYAIPTSSMPPVAWDQNGLSVCTTLLDFNVLQPGSAPFLFEGADGLLHLYFQNAGSLWFTAAHYNTVTARALYAVPWANSAQSTSSQTGTLRFIARQPGTLMNYQLPTTQGDQPPSAADWNDVIPPKFITIVQNSDDATLGTVTLATYYGGPSNQGFTETWQNVPLELSAFVAVLNGEARQMPIIPVSEYDPRVTYDYSAQVSVSPPGASPQPGPGTGSAIFSVIPETLPDNGLKAYVQAVPAVLVRPGIDNWWISDPPRSALRLLSSSPSQYVQVFEDQVPVGSPLSLNGSLCMEAWVIPPLEGYSGEVSSLILFNNPPEAQYMLGIDPSGHFFAGNKNTMKVAKTDPIGQDWTHVAASYQTDYGLKLSGTRYLDAGNNASLSTPEALTVEAWVKLDKNGIKQVVASKWDDDEGKSWQLYIDEHDKPVFEVKGDDGVDTSSSKVQSDTALKKGEWTYLAGVYDVASKNETAVMFPDEHNPNVSIPPIDCLFSALTFELWVNLSATPTVWFMESTLSGDGYISLGLQGVSGPGPQTTLTLNIGEAISLTADFTLDKWSHIAATNDPDKGAALYINGQMVAQTDESGPPVKGSLGLSVGNSCYGYINEVAVWDRALSIEEIRARMKGQLTGTERNLVGYWPFQDRYGTTALDRVGNNNGKLEHGATFTSVDKGQFVKKIYVRGEIESESAYESPHLSEAPVRIGTTNLKDYLQATVDDVKIWKTGRWDWEIENDQSHPFDIHATGLISAWTFDTGSGSIAYDAKGDNNAVILSSGKKLSEEELNKMWVPTWFKAGWTLYVNGKKIESVKDRLDWSLEPMWDGMDPQLVFGSALFDGMPLNNFIGQLAEVRIWNDTRTEEQIRDLMYEPLAGSEEGLVGYWSMNDGSGTTIGDQSPYGNNGTLEATDNGSGNWGVLMAPVDIEGSQVVTTPASVIYDPTSGSHSYYLDIKNFADKVATQIIKYTPSAVEYGDLQTDSAGRLFGVLKRCYCYIGEDDGALYLITGYKVGDLELQYIGQVQTKPALIGYIEGAPPLPSENLTVESPVTPTKYLGASSLTLTDIENASFIYSASRDTGFDLSVDSRVGVVLGTALTIGTGLGVTLETKVFDFKLVTGIHAKFSQSLGWLDDAKVSNEATDTTAKRIQFFGDWYANTYAINNGKGGIYVPNNMGYALVKSAVADMFALKLKTTGAMVGYVMRPDPDIPEDINILMFKINPSYVENGSLDGYIGFEPSHTYGNLQPGEKASYFKPLEAYALKQQIERESKQLKAYYDQFDAGKTGRRQASTQFQEGDIGDQDNNLSEILAQAASGDEDWKQALARRNLVNTYVWNSDGGLYSEEEQFSAVKEESTGGSYDFVGLAGAYGELLIDPGIEVKLDALFGGHIKTKSIKTKKEGASLGLKVTVTGESFLKQSRPNQPNEFPLYEYPVAYEHSLSPGKVSQYRFMSFYLSPKKQNFEDFFSYVVDQDWLNRQGNYSDIFDPDADALQQVRNNPNEVWRVMYRVTYVNRIPEQPETGPVLQTQSLPKPVQPPDEQSVNSNRMLIDDLPITSEDGNILGQISIGIDALFDAWLQMSNPPTWIAFLQNLQQQSPTQELKKQAEIKKEVMSWMRSYYEIF
ncbi:MAG TPA: LamG-like jellyroll fold domain-containing protein [Pyrinomonadaceae bacterium]|jgi:hypothetical protein